MKKFSLAFSLLIGSFVIAFFSCKKINEPTDLGGDLIPPVDNVTTFETTLDVRTNNLLHNDNDSLTFYDDVAVGHISNDPELGQTHANAYFKISRNSYGSYPFIVKQDSVVAIDSVILSLAYATAYGDTISGSPLTVRVFEVTDPTFTDTVFYKLRGTNDFATGTQYGSKTFTHKQLRDSQLVARPFDTTKVINVLRIPLSNSLGTLFKSFDTSNQYKNDSAFKAAFKGLAIKADNTGNSLAYFSLSDNQRTKLIVYYKARINGKDSTSSTEFYHIPIAPPFITTKPANFRNGQANVVTRAYSAAANAIFNNGNPLDDKLYIQTTPGTIATLNIPGLDNFQNKVIHRAEIIAHRINDPLSPFKVPERLMLDHITAGGDSASIMHNDLVVLQGGQIGFDDFGGTIKSDNTFRFNITRYVQGIITRKEPNDTLRIYAPLRTSVYARNINQFITLPVNSRIAEGRVVLAGGNYFDPKLRLRLRIIYSNL